MDIEPTQEGATAEQSPHVQDRFEALLENRLSDADKMTVESHLQLCDECRAGFQTLVQSRETLSPVAPPADVPPADVQPANAPPMDAPSFDAAPSDAPSPAPDLPGSFDLGLLHEEPSARRSWLKVAIPVLVLAGAALGGVYVFFLHPSILKQTTPPMPPMAHERAAAPAVTNAQPAASVTKAPPLATAQAGATKGSLVQSLNDQFAMKPMSPNEKPPKVVAEAPVTPAPPAAKVTPAVPVPARAPAVTAAPVMAKPAASVAAKPAPQIAAPAVPKPVASAPVPAPAVPAQPPVAAKAVPAAPAAASVPAADGSQEWKGDSCGIAQPMLVVAHNMDEWGYLWKAHYKIAGTPNDLPPIDFNRFVVIGVYAGQKKTGGYSVKITGTEVTPGALIVLYKETEPAEGTTPTPAATQPFHLKTLSKTPLVIQFRKL